MLERLQRSRCDILAYDISYTRIRGIHVCVNYTRLYMHSGASFLTQIL